MAVSLTLDVILLRTGSRLRPQLCLKELPEILAPEDGKAYKVHSLLK